uniref:Tetraspanin n=1 Tax=Steinernema glaseri TaxID=37863 RepID=A0A1I7Y4E5_9BILA
MNFHILCIVAVIAAYVVFEVLLLPSLFRFATNEWTSLLGISLWSPQLLSMFLSGALQLLTCSIGLLAVASGVKRLMYVYYSSVLFFTIVEIVYFFTWTFFVGSMHERYTQIGLLPADNTCPIWVNISENLNCLLPLYCSEYGTPFLVEGDLKNCTSSYLGWLHSETQYISMMMFFFLLPLKGWILFTALGDIRDMFKSYESPYFLWGTDEEEGFERPERKSKRKEKKNSKKGVLCTQVRHDTMESSGSGESQITLLTNEKSPHPGSPV